jgi:hypothetical protein
MAAEMVAVRPCSLTRTRACQIQPGDRRRCSLFVMTAAHGRGVLRPAALTEKSRRGLTLLPTPRREDPVPR